MLRFRNALICLAVLAVGAALSFAILNSSLRTPPPAAWRAPQRSERTASHQARRISFPAPTLQEVKRRLEPGETHVYPLAAKAGNLTELIVHQDGVDLQVLVLDPAGKLLFTVDSPVGRTGGERVLLAARKVTSYRIEVSGRSPKETGPYRIWIAAERFASDKDMKEAEAEKLFHQAREAIRSGDLRSPEQKLIEAGRLCHLTRNLGRQADALRLLGNLYRDRWEWQRALTVRQRAKTLYRQAGLFDDEGKAANDVGLAQEKLSDLAAARESYKEALVLGQRSQDRRVSAAALYNLGSLARLESKSAEALEDLEQARARWKGLGDSNEVKAATSIAMVYADAGKIDLAIAKFKETLELADQKKLPQQKAIALMQLGNALLSHDSEQAQSLYEQARAILQQQGDLESLAATLNGMGLVLLNREKYQETLEPFQKALQLYEREGNALDQARILTNLGWSYAGLQREVDARAAYERALVLAKGKDSWTEAGARLGLARLEEQSRNPIAARVEAEAAVRAVENLRAAVSRDLQISFLATKQDIYGSLIEILLWQHELQPSAGFDARALAVSEQAGSRGLLDAISEVRAPAHAKRYISTPRILSLSEIQRAVLDADTLLLEFHFGEKASYLWLVAKSSYRGFKLPPRARLEGLIEEAHRLLAESARREKLSDTWRTVNELSRELLGPAAPWLDRKRLLISGPAVLQGFPFAVLPDPAGLTSNADAGAKPLISEHEIVKVPSASVLAALEARQAGRIPPPDLLGMLADPVFELADQRLAGDAAAMLGNEPQTALTSLLGPFKRLVYARAEADAILKEARGGRVLTAFGFDANRDLVLGGRLRDYRNLQFITHGWLQADDADLSALVLSQVDRHGRRRDGFLRAADISKLDLPADLVVLSACETGLGEKIPGEGLVGLPQAFMTAGATALLVSLWPVDDLASAELMQRFYHQYIGHRLPPAAALREAQNSMRQSRRYSAPFYWGAFELRGSWRASKSPR